MDQKTINALCMKLSPYACQRIIQVLSIYNDNQKTGKELKKDLEFLIRNKKKSCKFLNDRFGRWEIFENKIQRWACVSTEFNKKLYILGGRDQKNQTRNTMYIFDLESKKTSKFKLGIKNEGGSLIGVEESLILFGGNDGKLLNSVWQFNLSKCAWKKIENILGVLPKPRECHIAHKVLNKMLVYGGKGKNQVFSDIFSLDLTDFHWEKVFQSGDSMGKRYAMASCMSNSVIYIFGGLISHEVYSKELFSLQFDNGRAVCKRFSSLNSPAPRAFCSLTMGKEGYLMVFAGYCGNLLSDLHAFDVENNKWHEKVMKNSVSARMTHVASFVRGEFLVIAGVSEWKTVCSEIVSFQLGENANQTCVMQEINLKRKKTQVLTENSSGNCAVFIKKENFIEVPEEITEKCEEIVRKIQIPMELWGKSNPFSALLRLYYFIPSKFVDFEVIGVVKSRKNLIYKLFPESVSKDFAFLPRETTDKTFEIRQNMLKSYDRSEVPELSVLKISFDSELTASELDSLCQNTSFFIDLFRFSHCALIISNAFGYTSVALLENTQNLEFLLFFLIFNEVGLAIYPEAFKITPILTNVYSKTHLSIDSPLETAPGLHIYLYVSDLISRNNDIFLRGCSFAALISQLPSKNISINHKIPEKISKILDFIEQSAEIQVYKSVSPAFSLLVFMNNKLIYWKYKFQNSPQCIILESSQDSIVADETTELSENLKKLIKKYSNHL